jgi:integrase
VGAEQTSQARPSCRPGDRQAADPHRLGHPPRPTRSSCATGSASRSLIDKFILPALGEQTLPALAKLGPRLYERLYVELRRCRRPMRRKPFIEHRMSRTHEGDDRCRQHVCLPLATSSVRQCHAVLSSAFAPWRRTTGGTTPPVRR